MDTQTSDLASVERERLIYRHGVVVRVTHWINVVCLTVLLMSGLQIFNAHPGLYFGQQSDFKNPVLAMTASGLDQPTEGAITIFGHSFDTTGFFGLTTGPDGTYQERAFPSWITLPGEQDLATGRRWHFFFAWLFVVNGLIYLVWGAINGHFRRDLAPSGSQLRHIGRSIWEHIRLKFPKGEEARRYNVLQKLSYLAVIFVLLPVMVLAGLAMSPGLDAAFPLLPTIFGGRQTARTVHFILAWTLVLFVVVHVAMVLLSGVWNNIRSMVTGRYDIGFSRDDKANDHAPQTTP